MERLEVTVCSCIGANGWYMTSSGLEITKLSKQQNEYRKHKTSKQHGNRYWLYTWLCTGFFSSFFGDCLIESDKIESGSVDLILTDLPYGTMEGQSKTGIYHNGEEKHEWDSIIDTDKIMQIANRILRKNGKMILFAQEPFTRELINKAIPNVPFNYRAIWLKDTLGSFMRSKSALLYRTEDILIFSKMNPKHDLELKHPYRDWETDRKSTRLNSSHRSLARMPSSA